MPSGPAPLPLICALSYFDLTRSLNTNTNPLYVHTADADTHTIQRFIDSIHTNMHASIHTDINTVTNRQIPIPNWYPSYSATLQKAYTF